MEKPMDMRYPAMCLRQRNGGYTVTFPDIPEIVTEGDDEAEALRNARHALDTVLAWYIRERRPIPRPSEQRRGQRLIAPSSLIAAKAALSVALARSGLSQRELARRMDVEVTAVQRLLDPKHRSRHDQLDAAFAALNTQLAVRVEEAA
jgi:antitoxin HicB